MKLVSYFPRRESNVPSIFDAMEELFNDMPTLFGNRMLTVPAVNIVELDDEYRLEMAAPGLDKKDFEIKIDNDVLTISARKEQKEEEKGKYTRREFGYFEFARSFTLPETVDPANIKARYENGVLYVSLPKKPEAKPQPVRTIKVG